VHGYNRRPGEVSADAGYCSEANLEGPPICMGRTRVLKLQADSVCPGISADAKRKGYWRMGWDSNPREA
jgi:hypothetical protein